MADSSTQSSLFHFKVRPRSGTDMLSGIEVLQIPCIHSKKGILERYLSIVPLCISRLSSLSFSEITIIEKRSHTSLGCTHCVISTLSSSWLPKSFHLHLRSRIPVQGVSTLITLIHTPFLMPTTYTSPPLSYQTKCKLSYFLLLFRIYLTPGRCTITSW